MIHNLLKKQAFPPLLFILFLISCVHTPPQEENRVLRMVYTDWSESVALTNLAAVLLEENLDYTVELKLTDVETVYEELADGKSDVFADAWLYETHKPYFEKHAGKIDEIGITYPEARTGFVVPKYSKLQTISDLEHSPQSIIGIEKEAGVMKKAEAAIEKYKLKTPLLYLSEAEMTERLADSILRRSEIVITGWEPHWMFARFEVRFLDDPDIVFGEREKIYTVARTNLEEKHPNAVRFFERMQLSEKQLNSLVYEVRLSEDPKQGVKKWIDENEYIVNQWVKNLKPERKKIM